MKKIISILVLTCMLGVMLCGCAGTAAEQPAKASAEETEAAEKIAEEIAEMVAEEVSEDVSTEEAAEPEAAEAEAEGNFDEPLDIAGNYIEVICGEYEEGQIFYYWLVLNEDGTGYETGNGGTYEITYDEETINGNRYYAENDGLVLFIGDYDYYYVKYDGEIPEDATDPEGVWDGSWERNANHEALPGVYSRKIYEEYDEEDGLTPHLFDDFLRVNEDGTGETFFQDYGPKLSSIKDGEAVLEDGTKCPCTIFGATIAIKFPDYDDYIPFTLTTVPYPEFDQ